MGIRTSLAQTLSPKAAQAAAAKQAEGAKSPAQEVGEMAKRALETPSISFSGKAPARLSERQRIKQAASWSVAGNWLIVLLVLVIGALTALEYRNPDSDLSLTSVVSGVVVLWIVAQIMRLIMIMGYGEVSLGIGETPSGKTDEADPEKPDNVKPDNEKQ